MKNHNSSELKKATCFVQQGDDIKALELLENIVNNEFDDSIKSEAFLQIGYVFKDPILGSGIRKNIKKAIENFEMASKLGSGDAFEELGNIYYFGDGLKENKVKAINFWKKGLELKNAASGLALLNHFLDYDISNSYEILELFKEISSFKSISKDIIFYKMGIFYLNKKNQIYNVKKGINFLEKSADLNNYPALFKLAQIYFDGLLVKRNLKTSLEFLEKAEKTENFFKDDIKSFKNIILTILNSSM